jgi:MFS family permease
MNGETQPSGLRNRMLLIAGGAVMYVALHFGNSHAVLVWIGHNRDIGYIAIAMLLPVYQAGYIAAQIVGANHLPKASRRRPFVIWATVLQALLLLLISALTLTLRGVPLALLMLLTAAAVGYCFGTYGLAGTDLLARTLPKEARGKALTLRATFGGLATLAAALLIWAAVPALHENEVRYLWIAAAAWLVTALVFAGIVETRRPTTQAAGQRMNLARARALFAAHRWLKHYIALRVLLFSVELAIPFYTVHIALTSGASSRLLGLFVAAFGLGQVLTWPVWGRWIDRRTLAILAAAPLMAIPAGLLVLEADMLRETVPALYFAVILILSLARQGALQARLRLLTVLTDDEDRPAVLALVTIIGITSALAFAFVAGLAGHMADIRIPLFVLIFMNALAAAYALWAARAFPSRGAEAG